MPGSIRDRPGSGAGPADLRGDWERRGLVGPLDLLSRREAAEVGRDFREQLARSGISATRNRHADLPGLRALCDHPALWPPAHDLLGDELLLWRTNMFLGNPDLPWHEDHHSRLFARPAFSLSMLLAIEASPPDNCTVFVPGSHRLTVPEKERRYGLTARPRAGGNVRYGGAVPAERREPVPLEAGQALLFHPGLLHASSGYVDGAAEPSRERMSLTFRIAAAGAELRDEAFPDAREERGAVLRTIRRPPASRA